jgi:1,4-alpha-glucan branching enzyme
MNHLALVIELHHPLPGPGESVGTEWPLVAADLYWPVIRAISTLSDRHADAAITVALSPAWTALAADPVAQDLTRNAIERREVRSEASRALRRFVLEQWRGDPIAALRGARHSGAIALIPTTASPTWLPSVAAEPVLARAQVGLAAADHALRFGERPGGIWLPFLAYRPGLETALAGAGLRYFGVDASAFLRGTVLPPSHELGHLVTAPGVAAFGVSPIPTRSLTDPERHYARDPRYSEPARVSSAVADHAAHFVGSWRDHASAAARGAQSGKISVASLSVHSLGGSWAHGPAWLDDVLRRLTWDSDWQPITLDRHLDHCPQGTLGRPGTSAGGLLSVRPGDSDVLDRCRIASETLAAFVERRDSLGSLGRRAVAQLTRMLLAAQALDWDLPAHRPTGTTVGLQRAERYLASFHELAGMVASGTLDPARVAALEIGPAYLPEIDLELLARD